MKLKISGLLALGLVGLIPAALSAQTVDRRISFEARGGVNVPTFDITDAAKAGPSFGATLGLRVAPRVMLLGEADFGFHQGADLPLGGVGPDVNVYHFMGKVGFDVLKRDRWSILVNAGAGALAFDVDGGPNETYFAVNVGAKIGYAVTPVVDVVLSPQGDIAFTDEAVLGTDNSWVWPFAAGIRFHF